MIVNTKLKEFLNELKTITVKYYNTPDEERNHYRRLLNLYTTKLTEKEQIFIIKLLVENLHYKNIVTDPDNVFTLHSIRLRNITYTFFLVIITMIIAAILFKTNDSLNDIVEFFSNVSKMLVL